jgi:HlyD family secretion protein
MKKFITLELALALAAGVCTGADNVAPSKNRSEAQSIQRGLAAATVTANGTVQPEDVYEVGAQVAGIIKERGVDYGTVVKPGSMLVKLDPTLYEAEVEQAKANLQRAEANLKLAKAKAVLAKREVERTKKRVEDKTADGLDVEVGRAALDLADLNVQVEEAALAQSKAALQRAQLNLDYTTIRSPIDGVIIDRRITVGQTVLPNLEGPSLFLIAKDLKKMDVWVSVPETDIAKVTVGQAASFTVDAHPKETFKGKVTQIRLNGNTDVKDRVTYTVTVATDNTDGKLLPSMTARVSIEVKEK